MNVNDTICAVSTPAGKGGIAVIRISGQDAIAACDKIFVPHGAKSRAGQGYLSTCEANKVVYGEISSGGEVLDNCLTSIFLAPRSFTGEDTVEISCHGSIFIQQKILQALIANGCRLARAGEFTQRAFVNGKIDLAQAEAVADLIASENNAAHRLAIRQMRGGFSNELKNLRGQLLHFASMIELELDFGDQEELEFANRAELRALIDKIHAKIKDLANSFAAGNAIKNGVPVAIIGKPNVGKSTLLNSLLNEERAIVSEVPGTTRDTVEETLCIEGVTFRIIDTAGLRENIADRVEEIGVRRSFEKAEKASIILYLFDLTQEDADDLVPTSQWLQRFNKPVLMIGTKNDIARRSPIHTSGNVRVIHISCKEVADAERVKKHIARLAKTDDCAAGDTIITNMRHYEALCRAGEAVTRIIDGIENSLSEDFLAQDVRDCLHYLGEITGEITSKDILDNIFAMFCIGK